MTPAIILVRPREEGNVGAVARAMANMGLHELILVEPAPPVGGVARGFGVGGWEILDAVRRVDSLHEAIAPFQWVVGTTSTRERGLTQARILTPRQLVELWHIQSSVDETSSAIVFGPENHGLSREELDLCHPTVAIPAALDHPTLNLAQAVMVLAYELFLARQDDAAGAAQEGGNPESPAPAVEVEGLMEQVALTLCDAGFDDRDIHARLMRDLRLLLNRSEASSREVRILRRIVNRARRKLNGVD